MATSPSNHGEGNPEAAEEFNKSEREFVASERGQRKIQEGAQVGAGEAAALEEAEKRGKSHARNDDSNTQAMKDKR